KNCDRIKMACLAQLVNVIAPIMTENGGNAWAQTIFYPFMHTSNYGRGEAFIPLLTSEKYDTERLKNVPYVEAIGVLNEEKTELSVFAVNRSLDENIDFEIDLRDFEDIKLIEHIVMENDDMKAINTVENPDNVVPHNNGVTKISSNLATATLNKHSWNVMRFQVQRV
ncbi:MAG: alpha-L-arabinofuranosidase C-terminal domain-containing protein, partial [Mobilitalea sp.]